jgi:hypothetical protein
MYHHMPEGNSKSHMFTPPWESQNRLVSCDLLVPEDATEQRSDAGFGVALPEKTMSRCFRI